MRIPGSLWRRVYGAVAKKPTNFSWVIDHMLSGSGMITTKEELDWVKKNGVKAVLTLTEEPLKKEWLNGIDYLHLPTINHSAPDIEDIEKATDFIERSLQDKKPVMVHCEAGMGRTGTILAGYMMKFRRMEAERAIEMIRNMRPGSVERHSQQIALSLFEKYLRKQT